MFLRPYPVHYSGVDRNKARPVLETRLFRFKDNRNHTYIIEADKLPYELYGINFFLKAHRLSKKKYSLVTGFGNAIPIIATCLSVMVKLYKANPNISFVIIGANSENEPKANTKRFKVYRKVLGRFFNPNTFEHREYAEQSAYLLTNAKQLAMDPRLAEKIISII